MARPFKIFLTFCLSISVCLATSYTQTPCTSAFLDSYASYGVPGGQGFKDGNTDKGSIYVLAPFVFGIPGYFLGLFAGFSGAPGDPNVYARNFPAAIRAQPLFFGAFKKAFNNGYIATKKIRDGDIVGGTNEAITPGICGPFGDIFGASDAFFGRTGSSDNYAQGKCPAAFLYGYNVYGRPGGQKIRNAKFDEGIIKVLSPFIAGIPGYFLAIGDGFSGQSKDPTRYTSNFPQLIREQKILVGAFDKSYDDNYESGVELRKGDIPKGFYDGFTPGFCGMVGISLGFVDGLSM